MTDIVDRLNDSLSAGYSELRKEAAQEILQLRKERDDVAQQLVQSEQGKRKISEECDALLARIEEMERQEPYAFVVNFPDSSRVELAHDLDDLYEDLIYEAHEVRKLYLAPGAQPAPSVPEGWKAVPVEIVDLYSFMCSAFTPMTPQQDQIAIQLDLAKRAMITSSLGLVDQAMTRSAAIRARGESDAP